MKNPFLLKKIASLPVLLYVLLLGAMLVPHQAGAAQLKGKITIDASGEEILPGKGAPIPLKRVKLRLGVLEAASSRNDQDDFIQSFYAYTDTQYTNDEGEFTFDLGDSRPMTRRSSSSLNPETGTSRFTIRRAMRAMSLAWVAR